MTKAKTYLKSLPKRFFITAFTGMAQGLFVTLIAGTILATVATTQIHPNAQRRTFMQFTSFLQDGNLTVALTGEIDHHCAKEYIRAISAKIEAYTPIICILDFSEVTFIDSSGVAVVINALRDTKRIDGRLLLTGIADQPMKVFRAAGIDKIIEIREVML